MATKFLDENGLLYFWSKIKATFIAKDGTKVLSANDYTTTEKTKLGNIEAEANKYVLPVASAAVLGGVKVDSSTIVINNGVISANSGLTFSRVASLPGVGQAGTIYLLATAGPATNVYDEYIWCDTTGTGVMGWEKIGSTSIDLSGYMLKTDMVAITNADIDTAVAT